MRKHGMNSSFDDSQKESDNIVLTFPRAVFDRILEYFFASH